MQSRAACPSTELFELLARAQALGRSQSHESIAGLLFLMEHDRPLVRSEAARALAQVGRALRQRRRLLFTIGQPRTDILTAQRLMEDIDRRAQQAGAFFRESWAESLGQWQHEGAVEALRALLADPSPRVRAAAAHALGNTHDQDAGTALRTAADDPDVGVRLSVAVATGAIGGDQGLDHLKDLLQDAAPPVRCAALQALAQIASPRALALLHDALQADSQATQLLVIDLLSEVGNLSSIRALERFLQQRPSSDDAALHGALTRAARQAVAQIERRQGTLSRRLWRGACWAQGIWRRLCTVLQRRR